MTSFYLRIHLTSVFMALCLGHNSNQFHLTILHTSDVTASFEQYNYDGDKCSEQDDRNGVCLGGVARRGTVIEEVRNKQGEEGDVNVLLLDGGDQFVGEWFNVYSGKATAHFMNKLGYDAMTFGNLEFALGPRGLAYFLEDINFDAVSANLNVSEEHILEGLVNTNVVKMVAGERIGITGFTTRRTNTIARVGNAHFDDVIESVQQEVDKLTSIGINKIVVIGHSYGLVEDQNEALEIARYVPGVDVIVLGGALLFQCNDCSRIAEDKEPIYRIAHYPMEITPKHNPDGKVLLVHGYIDGRYIGRLNVVFDEEGELLKWDGNPIRLDEQIKQGA